MHRKKFLAVSVSKAFVLKDYGVMFVLLPCVISKKKIFLKLG